MQKKRLTPKDHSEIDHALRRVVDSVEFSNATRLKEFLSYVTSEYQSGRGDAILGKTIAQDVYSRGADAIDKGASLVKVDAGRLRRRLREYYTGSGAGDPVHITIHRGGYTPSFHYVDAVNEGDADTPKNWLRVVWIGSTIGLTILLVFFLLLWPDKHEAAGVGKSIARTVAERQAHLTKSLTSLQAANLASQARSLIFPPLDAVRMQATLDMFERSIELDAGYYGGYAGAAQTLAMQAILKPDQDARSQLIAQARQRSDQATDLRPDASWSLSALALVKFADGDFDGANAASKMAVALDPTDFQALDIDGVIALFSGDFERAQQSSAPNLHAGRTGTRFIFRNIYAAASFHLGHPQDTIQYFTTAAEQGDPISQISVVYLVAANYVIGNNRKAEDLVKDFEESWPEMRIDILLERLFADSNYAKEPIELFKAAGWRQDGSVRRN